MMGKKKFDVLFIVMAVFLGAMCIGTEGIADQVPLTNRCDLITPFGGSGLGQYVTTVPSPTGEWPIPVTLQNGQAGYEWRYKLWNPAGSNSQIAILCPNCVNPGLGIVLETGMSVFPAGLPGSEIASKTGFGYFTDHDNVVKLSSQYNGLTGEFYIRTATNEPVRQTSMQFKNGNNFYWCPGIKGPDCPVIVNPLVPSVPAQPTIIDGNQFIIERHPRYGYMTDVKICNAPACVSDTDQGCCRTTDSKGCCSLPRIQNTIANSTDLCTSLNANSGFPECVISGATSPHTQTYTSNIVPPPVYPYCKSGETKVAATNIYGFECINNSTGVKHTDCTVPGCP